MAFIFVIDNKQAISIITDPYMPKSSDQNIAIITPLNTTYVEPMSGYYPATFGFENVENGDFPSEWIDESTGASSEVAVVSEIAGHKKVLSYYSVLTGQFARTKIIPSSPQISGSIEFYVYKGSLGDKGFEISLRNSTNDYALRIGIDWMNDGQFVWRTSGSTAASFGIGKYSDYTWFHIRIDFNISTKKFDIYLDGIKEVDQEDMFYDIVSLENLQIHHTGSGSGHWYLDALSFSWNNEIGENLKEGLLLSFENSTTLDWTGYSLDGTSNKTILGNSTIPLPEDGLHRIQVFGNDSFSANHHSDIRHFSVDIGSPEIYIKTPRQNEIFGDIPPSYELFILKPSLSSIWYTLDGGITNITSLGLTGTIDEFEWNKNGIGPVIIGFYANDSLGLEGYAEVSVVKSGKYTLNSPENKTYSGPMSGYYPATFGFENEEDGNFPTGWIDQSTGTLSEVVVASELAGHKKVLQYYSYTTHYSITNLDLSSPQINGSIEYYVYKDAGLKGFEIILRNSTGDHALRIGIDYQFDHKFIWRTSGSTAAEFGVGKFSLETWFHIRIDFNLVTNKFDIYLDGVKEVDQEDFFYEINSLQNIGFYETYQFGASNWYLDALSFSWDEDYNIGDNMYEGLLLNFQNPTLMDWIGYSLDGTSNKTILGNSTIPLPEDGLHTIQIFGNDSLGTNYQSDIWYFSVDTNAPQITITSPAQDEFFGVSPPDFEIILEELNLNTTWYTLDGGLTNKTFTGLTGTIDQTIWDPILADDVTIRFYANDSFGREGYSEVSFKKDLNTPNPSIVQDGLTFTITASDGTGSGVALIRYRINGSAWIDYTVPFNLGYGHYNITCEAIDEVGNIGSSGLIIALREPEVPDEPFNWTFVIMTSIIGGAALIVVITIIIRKRK